MNNEESMLVDVFKSAIFVSNNNIKFYKDSDIEDYLTDDKYLANIKSNLSYHVNDININNILDLIYSNFVFHQKSSLDDLVKCLCAYYIMDNNHDKRRITMRILNEHDINYIIKTFKDNPSFACDLLKTFYISYLGNDFRVTPSMVANDKFNYHDKVDIINDKLRNTIISFTGSLLATGYPTEDIYKALVGILNNLIKVEELESEEAKIISENRNYIKRLIYADIYEDSIKDYKELDEVNHNILWGIENEDYSLDFSLIECFDIIDYFLDLLYDVPVRRNNRQKLYQSNEKVLKKINPLYKMERVSR